MLALSVRRGDSLISAVFRVMLALLRIGSTAGPFATLARYIPLDLARFAELSYRFLLAPGLDLLLVRSSIGGRVLTFPEVRGPLRERSRHEQGH